MNRQKKGFTIIEVVLVLAIGGLIFLMVFIALPALQRSQRDTQRRQDVAIIASAVRQYMAHNHNNAPPDSGRDDSTEHTYDDDDRKGTTWGSGNDSKALRRYLVDLDPGGVTTVVSVVNYVKEPSANNRFTIAKTDIAGYVSVYVGAKCPDLTKANGTVVTIPQTKKQGDIIIMRYMENGHWYCLEV